MSGKPVDMPTLFPSTPNDVCYAGDLHSTTASSPDYEIPERRGGIAAGPTESMEQNVNHPMRYTKGKVECIDALESAVVGKTPEEAIYVANIIKYLWRYEEKEPLRSLKSAKWYLDRLIKKVEVKNVLKEPMIAGKANEASC